MKDYTPICPNCGKPCVPGERFCRDCLHKPKTIHPVRGSPEEFFLVSDEICERCRGAFAVRDRLCGQCLKELDDSRTKRNDVWEKDGETHTAYEGEDRYRCVPPSDDLGNYRHEALDTSENIERCLSCEIPAKYCTGGKCVAAYRKWQQDVNKLRTLREIPRRPRGRPKGSVKHADTDTDEI